MKELEEFIEEVKRMNRLYNMGRITESERLQEILAEQLDDLRRLKSLTDEEE